MRSISCNELNCLSAPIEIRPERFWAVLSKSVKPQALGNATWHKQESACPELKTSKTEPPKVSKRGSAKLGRTSLAAFETWRLRSGLRLDQDHEGFRQHAVVCHRLSGRLGLHRSCETSMSGTSIIRATRVGFCGVNECPDVGDTEWPEELLALGEASQ